MQGALCIAAFCCHFVIRHDAVGQLIRHLLSVMLTKDLVDWEKKGSLLPLNGRGDPIPQDLNSMLPTAIRGDFAKLVDSAVEIGLVNMYGATTKAPSIFLAQCCSILEDNDVSEATAICCRSLSSSLVNWGEPISKADFNGLISQYAALLRYLGIDLADIN